MRLSKKRTVASSRKSGNDPKPVAKKASRAEDKRRPRITVLIADDHSVVREGLVSLITRKADMSVVGEAANGREAVDLGNTITQMSRCSICACPN